MSFGSVQLLSPLGGAGLNCWNVPPYLARLNTSTKLVQSAGTMSPASTTAMVMPLPVTPLLRIVLTPYIVARSLGARPRQPPAPPHEIAWLMTLASMAPGAPALAPATGRGASKCFFEASHCTIAGFLC